ncbi:ATP-binding protein [Brasilonema sp. CT11]|nr:ATP-binding protein [Brasilonema sp. CT11]
MNRYFLIRLVNLLLICHITKPTIKKFAQDLLNEQVTFDHSTMENLKARIEEHGEEIERDRQEFNEVLKQLEKANERVAQLSQPITWEPATINATAIGNTIIQFFQKQRIYLDRSHWTGDKHEAVLYFHTTRLNPAQRIDIKALNEHGEYLGQFHQCLKPIVFEWDWQETHMLTAKVVMLQRPEKLKAKEATKEAIKNPLLFLKPSESLLGFVREAYHVGLWGETGTGKSTAISNIIGGMVQELGGIPDIRATIPKIDADTAGMFPQVDWLGVRNSVFGLLEAALEIQFRIYLNEQAFLKGEAIKDFDPVLFFIDEINMIFTRWGSINEADSENVLERFESTLSGVKRSSAAGNRLTYFQSYMKLELMNYKNQFAKRLVLFVWQTGRSLRVKSLIAGQNLKPGAFNMMKMDIANCAYIALGDAIEECKEKSGLLMKLSSIKTLRRSKSR